MDIDGTLVCKDGTISAEDREALAEVRRSGVQASLSTGRVAPCHGRPTYIFSCYRTY
jgi:hydroxymethylpyrimidine pyrophosphatase-like HAD family hydrolase